MPTFQDILYNAMIGKQEVSISTKAGIFLGRILECHGGEYILLHRTGLQSHLNDTQKFSPDIYIRTSIIHTIIPIVDNGGTK